MPYNTQVEERIAMIVAEWPLIGRKKMFGGVCFLFQGNLFCGVYKEYLILRLGAAAEPLLTEPHVRPFDITGKPMSGWVMVEPEGFSGDRLKSLLKPALDFVRTLPAK